jgi:hypothetical protein
VPDGAKVILAPSLIVGRHLIDNDGLDQALVELKWRRHVLKLASKRVHLPEGPKGAGVVPVRVEAVSCMPVTRSILLLSEQ